MGSGRDPVRIPIVAILSGSNRDPFALSAKKEKERKISSSRAILRDSCANSDDSLMKAVRRDPARIGSGAKAKGNLGPSAVIRETFFHQRDGNAQGFFEDPQGSFTPSPSPPPPVPPTASQSPPSGNQT